MKNIILQYSIGRSGSTMIWQILKELCEPPYKVIKCHSNEMFNDYKNSTYPIVITQRDPRDSMLSFIRISHFGKNTELFESGLTMDIIKSTVSIWKNKENNLRHYVTNYSGPSVVLKYEKFYNNYDYIFNKLGTLFDLGDLTDDFKNKIIDKTCLETNQKAQASLGNDFNNYHAENHPTEGQFIHGGHIKHPQPKLYERILNEKEQSFLNSQLEGEIEFWKEYWKNN